MGGGSRGEGWGRINGAGGGGGGGGGGGVVSSFWIKALCR